MAYPTRRGNGAFVFGAIIGGLIGSAVGLWQAPRSGTATRRELLSMGNRARRQAEQAVVGERIEDAVAEGKALALRRQAELKQG